MKDIQASKPDLPLVLEKVGVSDVKWPFTLKDKNEGEQSTIGLWNMYVEVPENQKGTHMSRFIERLQETTAKMDLSLDRLQNMTKRLIKDQEATHAEVSVKFDYFISYTTPSSFKKGLLPLKCRFTASTRHKPILTVRTPVHTCCPCSKEMCKKNTHNQRGHVTIAVQSEEFIWIEDISQIAINASSGPVMSLVKRPDEKALVDYAYRNPRFVEDVARSVKSNLSHNNKVTWYKVKVKNFESIHDHNAYAETKGGKFE